MSKMLFTSPMLYRGGMDDPGEDPIIVIPDSGQGGETPLNPVPCNFAYWQQNFHADLNGDNTEDFSDYGLWWIQNGFDADAWNEYNSGVPFPNP